MCRALSPAALARGLALAVAILSLVPGNGDWDDDDE